MALLVGALVVWALAAPLDEGIPAQGLVSLDTKRKPVQHLQGGIVKEVLVGEGAAVQEGQVLMVLEQATAASTPDELIAIDRRCREIVWEAADNRFLTDTLDML
jgi:protease secretion system membrane fusion protein